MKRRTFLTAAGASVTAMAAPRVFGANDRIIAAVMGIHDRGMDLARELVAREDVELRYLADPDARLFSSRVEAIREWGGASPQCVQDMREVLDDRELDVVAIATPDHWHALAAVWACQAGKDVYVEKPTSQSIWESRKMVEAARKYDRVVQVGTQNRSAEYCREAVEFVRGGGLGDVHFIRVMNSKLREPMEAVPDGAAPAGVDYDLWLGPAPRRPFNPNHFHYNWHWFWDYGGGDLSNDGVHQIDLARWVGGVRLPHHVVSVGGPKVLDNVRETPDTQTATWEFDGLTMSLEQTLWTPYMKKVPFELRDTDTLPEWPFAGTRIDVYGTKNFMFFSRMGGGWQVFDGDGKSSLIRHGRFSPANTQHMNDFIACVRSRRRPVADIEEGHLSTLLAHYGNVAWRAGQRLEFDPATQGFVGNEAANDLAKRTYRAPYVVPDEV